jgi:hypothetical protein
LCLRRLAHFRLIPTAGFGTPIGDVPGPRGQRKRIAVDYLFIRQSGVGVTGARPRKCNELWTRNQLAVSGFECQESHVRASALLAAQTSHFIHYINAEA